MHIQPTMSVDGSMWKARVAYGPMGLTVLSIARTDQPDVFPMPLEPEHLVMTKMLHIGDRLQLQGEKEEENTTWVVVDAPSTDEWADPEAQLTLRSEADDMVLTRDAVESKTGQRGLENWAMWERSEGWVPLLLVGERLVELHRSRDVRETSR